MVLDVCPPLPSQPDVIELAVKRTALWAARARAAHTRDDQALFGIVQGGTDPGLRRQSAIETAELDFDGYGIGGLSVGETRAEMLPALACGDGGAADRPAAVPDGRGRSGVARRGDRARRRPIRLRDADPARPSRHGVDERGQAAREGGAPSRRGHTDRRDVCLRRVHAPHARLHPPSLQRCRAVGVPAREPPQRCLDARPDGTTRARRSSSCATTAFRRDVLSVWE